MAFCRLHDGVGVQISGRYVELGNVTRGRTEALVKFHDTWSAVALVPSAPFAMSEMLPHKVWQAISIFLRNAK
ncbi:MAG: hypothetical protein CMH23_01905 [Methylophaga sp.]|nr:hypothetical protein [Methylophaga sp.]